MGNAGWGGGDSEGEGVGADAMAAGGGLKEEAPIVVASVPAPFNRYPLIGGMMGGKVSLGEPETSTGARAITGAAEFAITGAAVTGGGASATGVGGGVIAAGGVTGGAENPCAAAGAPTDTGKLSAETGNRCSNGVAAARYHSGIWKYKNSL